MQLLDWTGRSDQAPRAVLVLAKSDKDHRP